MIDDLSAATPILPVDSGTWYPDDDHIIGYQIRFHARNTRTLDRANLARWVKAPVIR